MPSPFFIRSTCTLLVLHNPCSFCFGGHGTTEYAAIARLSLEQPSGVASSHSSGVRVRSGSSRPNAICQSIEQLRQPRLVRIAGEAVAIWLDPLRVLDAQVVMDLLFEFGVSIDLVRHRS